MSERKQNSAKAIELAWRCKSFADKTCGDRIAFCTSRAWENVAKGFTGVGLILLIGLPFFTDHFGAQGGYRDFAIEDSSLDGW